MRFRSIPIAVASIAALTSTASAQLTITSPAGATLPSGVTVVGGIVTDLLGANGNHVVSQIAASSLYVGYADANPLTIGSLSGFSPSLLASLGGGITAAAFRFTLDDGDTSPGEFDYDHNTLLVNGLTFAGNNWSSVTTQQTSSTGAPTSAVAATSAVTLPTVRKMSGIVSTASNRARGSSGAPTTMHTGATTEKSPARFACRNRLRASNPSQRAR